MTTPRILCELRPSAQNEHDEPSWTPTRLAERVNGLVASLFSEAFTTEMISDGWAGASGLREERYYEAQAAEEELSRMLELALPALCKVLQTSNLSARAAAFRLFAAATPDDLANLDQAQLAAVTAALTNDASDSDAGIARPAQRALTSLAWIVETRNAFGNGNVAGAIDTCRRAMDHDPDRAVAALGQMHCTEAAETLATIVIQQPKWVNASRALLRVADALPVSTAARLVLELDTAHARTLTELYPDRARLAELVLPTLMNALDGLDEARAEDAISRLPAFREQATPAVASLLPYLDRHRGGRLTNLAVRALPAIVERSRASAESVLPLLVELLNHGETVEAAVQALGALGTLAASVRTELEVLRAESEGKAALRALVLQIDVALTRIVT